MDSWTLHQYQNRYLTRNEITIQVGTNRYNENINCIKIIDYHHNKFNCQVYKCLDEMLDNLITVSFLEQISMEYFTIKMIITI